ncbi:hypothetical protein ANN_23689 [Periplaneta americana]|uniref:Transposable element P transposase-like RNase H domain-containing protein n=1 Tax=Periplaneta americana TaxID=6978 RepID=A0ABQ8SLT2_PERAM|nr:hypothetical protein ANN_23689 [Periplaneta americana]
MKFPPDGISCQEKQDEITKTTEKLQLIERGPLHKELENVKKEADEGSIHAKFILDQLLNHRKRIPRWNSETIRECIILQYISPKGYSHIRSRDFCKLPSKRTLTRYSGPTDCSSGVTPLIKERLVLEAKNLTVVERFSSLIVDEAAINPKIIYDRKLDTFFGYKETTEAQRNEDEILDILKKEVMANRVLCFVLRGLSTSYRKTAALARTDMDMSSSDSEEAPSVRGNISHVPVVCNDERIDGNKQSDDLIEETVVQLARMKRKAPEEILEKQEKISHYTRRDSEKKFLPSYYTLKKLCEEYQGQPKINRVGRPKYEEIFHPQNNAIKIPNKDIRAKCGKFQMQLAVAPEDQKLIIKDPLRIHQEDGIKTYLSKAADKEKSRKESQNKETVVFNLQQCLLRVKAFSSDPVESLFSTLRRMSGSNDMLDARAVNFSLQKILKTGILCMSNFSSVENHASDITNGRPFQEVDMPDTAAAPCSIPESVLNILQQLLNQSVHESQEGKVRVFEGVNVPSPREPYVIKLEDHRGCCNICTLGLEVKHTDVLILSQFLRSDGCMLPRRVTGLCRKQQKRISYMVAMAQKQHKQGTFLISLSILYDFDVVDLVGELIWRWPSMLKVAGLMPNIAPSSSKMDPKKRRKWKKYNTYFDEATIKDVRSFARKE